MTKGELLALLHEEADRLNLRRITERTLDRWIELKLFEGASPTGRKRGLNPLWAVSPEAVEHARQANISWGMGAKRTTALVVQLWVLGQEFPLDRVKRALRTEFRRLLKREQRDVRWKYDHRTLKQLDATERAKHERRIPPLDKDLRTAGFSFTADVLLQWMSEAHWGAEDGAGTRKSVGEPSALQISKILQLLKLDGILGDEEEIEKSGYEMLSKCGPDDLLSARLLFWIGAGGLFSFTTFTSFISVKNRDKLDFAGKKALNSLFLPDWTVFTLTAAAMVSHRWRDEHGKDPPPNFLGGR